MAYAHAQMGALFRNLRIIGAALFGRKSPMPYRMSIPAGWKAFPANGRRHYDEYQSPDDRSSVRVFSFEASATTLDDMIEDDLAGIRGHEGASIHKQSSSALKDGRPAHRIEYSITTGAVTRHGVDVMAEFDRGRVLVTLTSDEPITVLLMNTFTGMIDSLEAPGDP